MRRLALLAYAFAACVVDLRAQPADLVGILSGLAERTQQYYDRFISIICTETVRTQDLRFNLAPTERPRTTVYELSVSRGATARLRFASSARFSRWMAGPHERISDPNAPIRKPARLSRSHFCCRRINADTGSRPRRRPAARLERTQSISLKRRRNAFA